jgi:hypothetical protein
MAKQNKNTKSSTPLSNHAQFYGIITKTKNLVAVEYHVDETP